MCKAQNPLWTIQYPNQYGRPNLLNFGHVYKMCTGLDLYKERCMLFYNEQDNGVECGHAGLAT